MPAFRQGQLDQDGNSTAPIRLTAKSRHSGL
jgi:hypothetical protein